MTEYERTERKLDAKMDDNKVIGERLIVLYNLGDKITDEQFAEEVRLQNKITANNRAINRLDAKLQKNVCHTNHIGVYNGYQNT